MNKRGTTTTLFRSSSPSSPKIFSSISKKQNKKTFDSAISSCSMERRRCNAIIPLLFMISYSLTPATIHAADVVDCTPCATYVSPPPPSVPSPPPPSPPPPSGGGCPPPPSPSGGGGVIYNSPPPPSLPTYYYPPPSGGGGGGGGGGGYYYNPPPYRYGPAPPPPNPIVPYFPFYYHTPPPNNTPSRSLYFPFLPLAILLSSIFIL